MMFRTMAHSTVSRTALLSLLLTLLVVTALHAQADSTARERDAERIILHKGNLNRDGFIDTVFGGVRRNLDIVPVRIAWGHETGRAARVTTIKLPNWKRWQLSFAVEDMNGDTTEDLVFLLHGTVRVQGRDRDTVRPLVVFGQSGLDSLRQLNLNAVVRGFQSGPFISMDLRQGEHLRNRARRDISGFESYELRRPQLAGGNDSSGRALPGKADRAIFAVYPNPAGHSATVEATRLPEGEYRVMLMSVNGTRYAELEAIVSPGDNLIERIDVLDVPTGYYFVRVYTGNRHVGDFPIVVLH